MKSSMKTIVIAAIACIASQTTNAQQNTKPKKVKVHIQSNNNGKMETFDAEEITPEVEKRLKEAGVNITDLKSGGVITINSSTSSKTTSATLDDSSSTIKTINIIGGDGSQLGHEVKAYSFNSSGDDVSVVINGEETVSSNSNSKGKTKKVLFVMVNLSNATAEDFKKAGIAPTKESLEINEVICMPNPTNTGKFKISFKSENKNIVELVVRDINGKVILKEQAINSNGEFSKEIDLGNQANGIYFVTINQDGKATTKKLVVN